jgi:hypothetical protein
LSTRRQHQSRLAAAGLVGLAVFASVGTTAAQTQGPGAPGPYVVDVHAGLGALPGSAVLFPPLPSGTTIPAAGLAVNAGGHVYLISIGPARIGIGASVVRASGRTSPPQAAGTTAGTTAGTAAGTTSGLLPARPDVETRITAVAPQLSLNFGTSDGWSYISAGIGRAKARATTSAFATGTGTDAVITDPSVVSGSLRAVNFGGGARWFTKRHVAISFDVRFHQVSDAGGEVAIPRTTLTVVTAGFSFR